LFFLFFVSFIMIIFYNVHYMYVLLLLEILLLRVFMYLVWGFLSVFGLVGLFTFLLILVCMGGFRVSLLISVARLNGRDF